MEEITHRMDIDTGVEGLREYRNLWRYKE